jgi:hypothetical protein
MLSTFADCYAAEHVNIQIIRELDGFTAEPVGQSLREDDDIKALKNDD